MGDLRDRFSSIIYFIFMNLYWNNKNMSVTRKFTTAPSHEQFLSLFRRLKCQLAWKIEFRHHRWDCLTFTHAKIDICYHFHFQSDCEKDMCFENIYVHTWPKCYSFVVLMLKSFRSTEKKGKMHVEFSVAFKLNRFVFF